MDMDMYGIAVYVVNLGMKAMELAEEIKKDKDALRDAIANCCSFEDARDLTYQINLKNERLAVYMEVMKELTKRIEGAQ